MERDKVIEAAHALAAAISRRDTAAVRELVTPDFLLRTPGKGAVNVDAFVAGIQQIPGEIVSVRLEHLELDPTPAGVLVTGIQHAQVRIEGTLVQDVRPFVDWFVQSAGGRWQVKVAVDLPSAG
jgi:ketosteroid isomerase-like protein